MADDLLVIEGEGAFRLMKPLIGFRDDLARQLERSPYSRNVFLMMKFREANHALSDFISETLSTHGFVGVRADAPQWNITGNVYNPLAVLYCCKYGIALFDEPEDGQSYSPNVAYELGIMHYQRKNCLILRHDSLPPVPFDLIKDLYAPYQRDLAIRPAVLRWVESIAKEPLAEVPRVPDVSPPPSTDANVETSSDALCGSNFAYRILQSSGSHWQFAWKLVAQNKGPVPTKIQVRIEYYDAEGFCIACDDKYPDRPLESEETRAISNQHHMRASLAERAQSAKAFVNKW